MNEYRKTPAMKRRESRFRLTLATVIAIGIAGGVTLAAIIDSPVWG